MSACHASDSARIELKPRPTCPDGLPVSAYLAIRRKVLVRRDMFERRRNFHNYTHTYSLNLARFTLQPPKNVLIEENKYTCTAADSTSAHGNGTNELARPSGGRVWRGGIAIRKDGNVYQVCTHSFGMFCKNRWPLRGEGRAK